MEDKNKRWVLVGVVVAIIVVIFLINYAKSNGNHDDTVMKCIASKTVLYVSKTCGHCAAQKELLGESIGYFEVIDCTTNYDACATENIMAVPTWVIDGEKHTGKRSVTQLKELTGCG